jgi:ribosomal protein S18 acetylase RimI-like enzyme
MYDVCVRTADAGGDGRHLYEDHELPGHMWTGAYLALEPDLAFVLEDDDGVAGYIIGALDTRDFERRCEATWWPALRKRYPDPADVPRIERTRDEHLRRAFHRPVLTPTEPIVGYPSHLHIDILPRGQGRGIGLEMMNVLMEALRAKGSPGVHLGVSHANERAVRFYQRLSFSTLADYGEFGLLLGLRL